MMRPLHLCLFNDFNDVYVDCKYIAFIWYTNVDDNSCLSFFCFYWLIMITETIFLNSFKNTNKYI